MIILNIKSPRSWNCISWTSWLSEIRYEMQRKPTGYFFPVFTTTVNVTWHVVCQIWLLWIFITRFNGNNLDTNYYNYVIGFMMEIITFWSLWDLFLKIRTIFWFMKSFINCLIHLDSRNHWNWITILSRYSIHKIWL